MREGGRDREGVGSGQHPPKKDKSVQCKLHCVLPPLLVQCFLTVPWRGLLWLAAATRALVARPGGGPGAIFDFGP